jgi:hypothetical protein
MKRGAKQGARHTTLKDSMHRVEQTAATKVQRSLLYGSSLTKQPVTRLSTRQWCLAF